MPVKKKASLVVSRFTVCCKQYKFQVVMARDIGAVSKLAPDLKSYSRSLSTANYNYLICAFYQAFKTKCKHVGRIVLPANDEKLIEYIVHETVHAGMHALGGRLDHCNEENAAVLIGVISKRIADQCRKLGYLAK